MNYIAVDPKMGNRRKGDGGCIGGLRIECLPGGEGGQGSKS